MREAAKGSLPGPDCVANIFYIYFFSIYPTDRWLEINDDGNINPSKF
jgi:hypothetical protein